MQGMGQDERQTCMHLDWWSSHHVTSLAACQDAAPPGILTSECIDCILNKHQQVAQEATSNCATFSDSQMTHALLADSCLAAFSCCVPPALTRAREVESAELPDSSRVIDAGAAAHGN